MTKLTTTQRLDRLEDAVRAIDRVLVERPAARLDPQEHRLVRLVARVDVGDQ
jgi:hypothetical protein